MALPVVNKDGKSVDVPLEQHREALCISSCLPFPTSMATCAPCSFYVMTGSLYRSPLVISAQIIRAVLLASATAATLLFAGPSVASAMAAWSRSARHSG